LALVVDGNALSVSNNLGAKVEYRTPGLLLVPISSFNPVRCVDTAGSFIRPPSMPLTALKPGERYPSGERQMKGDTRCPK
jgi:hypothetical protein